MPLVIGIIHNRMLSSEQKNKRKFWQQSKFYSKMVQTHVAHALLTHFMYVNRMNLILYKVDWRFAPHFQTDDILFSSEAAYRTLTAILPIPNVNTSTKLLTSSAWAEPFNKSFLFSFIFFKINMGIRSFSHVRNQTRFSKNKMWKTVFSGPKKIFFKSEINVFNLLI